MAPCVLTLEQLVALDLDLAQRRAALEARRRAARPASGRVGDRLQGTAPADVLRAVARAWVLSAEMEERLSGADE